MSRYDSVILADNPTRYYKCNEPSGLIWVDSSGNAGNGSIVPAGGVIGYQQPSIVYSEAAGRSIRENGDGGYCVPDPINYSPSLTIEFWMTWADTWENEGALPSSPSNGQAGILRRDSTLGTWMYFNGNSYIPNMNPTIPTDKPNHPYFMTCVWNSGTFTFFVNGSFQSVASSPTGHSFTLSNPPQFGSQSFGTQWCWDGLIQNVAIYNGVELSPERIAAHYRAGIGGPPFAGYIQIPG